MQDTALILIEAQDEWFSPEGRLHDLVGREGLEPLRGQLGRLLSAARSARIPIFHAHLTFRPGHPELGFAEHGLRAAMARHDVWTGQGCTPARGLEPLEGEPVVTRTGSSAFAGSGLDNLLRHQGVSRVIVAGLASHVCVLATTMQAHDLGYDVVVPRETSVAFAHHQHATVMDDIAPHYAWVKPLDATLDHLQRRAAVVRGIQQFLDGLRAGDSNAVGRVLDPSFVAEGALEGAWCRWKRSEYLQRVAQFGPSVQRSDLVRLRLIGNTAEANARVEVPHGVMHDRLSWLATKGTWTLQHKSFHFQPVHE